MMVDTTINTMAILAALLFVAMIVLLIVGLGTFALIAFVSGFVAFNVALGMATLID